MSVKYSGKYSLQELEEVLDQPEIKHAETGPKTFLEIINREHYEIYWSRVYAYFFDPKEDHDLGDLFIRSILELIQKPEWNLGRNETSVRTEVSTENFKRIDLLIRDKKRCIIIENKIYHHSKNNDFEEYWEHVYLPQHDKVAVLLTLKEEKQKYKNFTNVTHHQLINQVMKNLESLEEVRPSARSFLEDWERNIKKMNSKTLNKEQVNFFWEHQEKLLDARNFYDSAKKYILKEAEVAIGKIEELILKSGNQNQDYRSGNSIKVPSIEFLVDFRNFDASCEMHLILKINSASKNPKEYRRCLENKGKILKTSDLRISGPNDLQVKYGHLAKKTYSLGELKPENLSSLISEEYTKFQPILEEFEELLKKKENQSPASNT